MRFGWSIADALRDNVISQPTRIFALGLGAGAVGGFAVMRIDPQVIATERLAEIDRATTSPPAPKRVCYPKATAILAPPGMVSSGSGTAADSPVGVAWSSGAMTAGSIRRTA